MKRRFLGFVCLVFLFLAPAMGPKLAWREPDSVQDPIGDLINQDAQISEHARGDDLGFTGPFHEVTDSPIEQWPERVYIDSDLDVVKITKEPGQTWTDCNRSEDACLDLANSQTVLMRDTRELPQERSEISLSTGKLDKVQYIKVHFTEPTSGNSGDGWIQTNVLRKVELKPIYKTQVAPVPMPRPHQSVQEQPGPVMAPTPIDVSQLNAALKKSSAEQLDASVGLIQPLIGQCPLRPSTQKRLAAWTGKNIYDQEALPILQKTARQPDGLPVVLMQADDSKTYVRRINLRDMIDIDALARTVYAEMSSCVADGVQYPMAAVKVMLNRSEALDSGKIKYSFLTNPQSSGKDTVAKVATSSEFSVWNRVAAKSPSDETVLMSLCPMTDPASKKNWNGTLPTPEDIQAWNMSVKIATEAVLFRQNFEAKTSQVKQYYYTSGMSKFGKHTQAAPTPKIEGRAVDSLKCMYLWN